MQPPPNEFKTKHWKLYYKICEKVHNNEYVSDKNFICYSILTEKRHKWCEELLTYRQDYYKKHNYFI